MTAINDIPHVLDPIYGACIRRDAAKRRHKAAVEARSYNKARRARIDKCWTCYHFGHSACDPRHCKREE